MTELAASAHGRLWPGAAVTGIGLGQQLSEGKPTNPPSCQIIAVEKAVGAKAKGWQRDLNSPMNSPADDEGDDGG